MTDKEIIKALECYRGQKLFAFNGKKPEIYIHDILDLINRQQAEIEKLRESLNFDLDNFASEYDSKIKAEAIKEFAERLRSHYDQYDDYDDIYVRHIRDDIDFTLDDMIENTERKKLEDEKDT